MKKVFIFLLAAALVLSFSVVATGPVAASPADWYVDASVGVSGDGLTPETAFKTIGEAITVAGNGQTIEVHEGTYVEQLSIIDKSITLQGVGASKPVIQAPAAASRTTRIILESGRTFDPIIYIDGETAAIEVTVDYFEIDGLNDPGSHNFVGILARNVVPGMISDNYLHSLIGSQETLGISVYGEDSEVTISGNLITGFSRNGITVIDAAAADVEGNTIVGRGYIYPGWAQNGIQFWGVDSGTVTGNTLSEMGWIWPEEGTSWSATGILIWECYGTTLVEDNELADVQVAIRFVSSSFAALGNTVLMASSGPLDYTGGIWGNPSGRPETPAYPFDSGLGGEGLGIGVSELTDLTFLFQGNTVIGDNALDGWGIAIWPYTGPNLYAEAYCNDVRNWDIGFDIWGYDSFSATIYFNNIVGNNYGMWNWTTTVVDGRYNWWGDASGPSGFGLGGGDAVSDNVIFYPWVDAAFDEDCVGGEPVYLLDHFKVYDVVGGVAVEELVLLQDQFGIYEAMVLAPLFFGNPVAKEHEGVLTDIWNPDDHLTFYGLSPQDETQTWCVEVYNQFGLQNFRVADPVMLGVPTQKDPHEPNVGPDHYLLYEVIGGEPLEELVWLWDQFSGDLWEETLVLQPVFCANPVAKLHGDVLTEVEDPEAHLVFYRIVGEYAGEVLIDNQFGPATLFLSDAALLALPSDKISFARELVIEDVTMQYNVDGGEWTAAGGSFAAGFSVCLDATAGEWYYLDVDTLVASRDVKVCELNPFYLKIVDSETFAAWWAAKMAEWPSHYVEHMEKILAGEEPMFYLHFDGDDYKLIDGFQYWLYSGGSNTLRLHSDYPPGTYTFEGAVAGATCCKSAPFQVVMTFCEVPMISFGFNGVEAGHNAEFEYCYGVPVTVTLHEIYAGEAPFSVTYKIDGGDPVTVEDLGKGGVIEAGQVLDPGTYTITVTAIEDANGCFASQAFLDLCVATVTIHPLPEVTDFTLQYKIDEGEWEAAEGSFATGFTIYLDAEAGTWYYLDVDTLTANVDLKVCELNPFYLKDVDSEDFVDWWAAKMAGWPSHYVEHMEKILAGEEPMFYLHFDGDDYKLIDGFQHWLHGTPDYTLRLHSDYPPGTYTFEGAVAGADCCGSELFQVVITFVDEVVPLAEIQGQTKEVNCEPLTGVTITLLQNGTVIATTESDGDGNYTLAVPDLGEYTVVASMAGFRDRERSVSVTELTAYTVDFVADHGLIPDAPNMSYVLACINLWQYGEPHCKLTMSTVLAVINAWQYPILEGEIT